jgi:hypothetical protein
MTNAYPSAGNLPVDLDGPEVGADAEIPAAATKDASANPKSKVNNMVEQPDGRVRGVLTEQ